MSQTQPGTRYSRHNGQLNCRSIPCLHPSVSTYSSLSRPHTYHVDNHHQIEQSKGGGGGMRNIRSRTTSQRRRIIRAPIPIPPDPRRPARPVGRYRHPRPRRVARVGRVPEPGLASRRRQAELVARSAIPVLRAALRVRGAREAEVLAGAGAAAGFVGGDDGWGADVEHGVGCVDCGRRLDFRVRVGGGRDGGGEDGGWEEEGGEEEEGYHFWSVFLLPPCPLCCNLCLTL